MFLKKHKNKIIAGVAIAAILTASFFWGAGNRGAGAGNSGSSDLSVSSGTTETPDENAGIDLAQNNPAPASDSDETGGESQESNGVLSAGSSNDVGGGESATSEQTLSPQPDEDYDELPTDVGETDDAVNHPQETGHPQEIEQLQETQEPVGDRESGEQNQDSGEEGEDGERELTITLVISCATILNNMDRLPTAKTGLIPAGGIIMHNTAIFYEGESVFNVLQRETRSNRIHMEFVNAPIYNSAYIEGINNIYEFDCGEGSGWMYSVNGSFPNFGSSRYTLSDGDVVMWLYTCDRGADIGGGDASDSYNFG